ncbi:MAG: nitroreductase [Pseudomonadota bacterium]
MMSVSEALKARTSIRAFKSDPVSEALVREILDAARFAPSGGNVQPWRVIAVAGAARDAVVTLAQQTLLRDPVGEEGERPAYPPHLWEPYRTRRFANGEQMYALLDIPRGDKPARLRHVARNFEFFGAPVGLFFVIDRRLGHAQWAHLGMFMQSVALAATERGLSTCMQEFWGWVRETLARHFELPADDMIYCGMALGYADESAAVNRMRSEREGVDGFAVFRGF